MGSATEGGKAPQGAPHVSVGTPNQLGDFHGLNGNGDRGLRLEGEGHLLTFRAGVSLILILRRTVRGEGYQGSVAGVYAHSLGRATHSVSLATCDGRACITHVRRGRPALRKIILP